jgi:hypothetical protein
MTKCWSALTCHHEPPLTHSFTSAAAASAPNTLTASTPNTPTASTPYTLAASTPYTLTASTPNAPTASAPQKHSCFPHATQHHYAFFDNYSHFLLTVMPSKKKLPVTLASAVTSTDAQLLHNEESGAIPACPACKRKGRRKKRLRW